MNVAAGNVKTVRPLEQAEGNMMEIESVKLNQINKQLSSSNSAVDIHIAKGVPVRIPVSSIFRIEYDRIIKHS
jgi:hypothetical protein